MPIDLSLLRTFISNMYTDVAQYPRGDFHFATGRPLMESLGYTKEQLDRVPSTALESCAGVGYYFHLEALKQGEHVVDFGGGAGSDIIIAAQAVGPSGVAVAVEMTEAMVKKARGNIERAGLDNATVHQGFIEEVPFDDESFDCVISNGVINLSPRKEDVFAHIHRILKPGGRLMFSDLVTGVELPVSVRENCELWAECIGGAMERNRYLALIEEAGLSISKVEENDYKFIAPSTKAAADKFQVTSLSILAHKPS